MKILWNNADQQQTLHKCIDTAAKNC